MEAFMAKGRFIVFEGIDGAGTTTQAMRLASSLGEGKPLASWFTNEPSDHWVGVRIRRLLSNPDLLPSWKVMSLLFSADRQDHYEYGILRMLDQGRDVFCDRYILSTLAYQGATSAVGYTGKEWKERIIKIIPVLHQFNVFAGWPDLTIYLDVPAEVAWDRVNSRGEETEVYEKIEFQKQVLEVYRILCTSFGLMFPNVVTVDGTGTEEEVASRCLEAVDRIKVK